MKKTIRIYALSILFWLIPTALALSSGSADQKGGKINWMDGNWRVWDVNADGQFDKQDIDQLLADGWQTFSADLNFDGKTDPNDVFALYVKLSVLDRNGDEAVNDDDYKPLSHIELPEADYSKALAIINEIVPKAHIASGLEPDAEEKLFSFIPEDRKLSPAERCYVFQSAGLSALFQKNLQAAQWAFGRAFQVYPSSATALGNLAFTIAKDKDYENAHQDALVLLALAREYNSESAATSAMIGWIYSRHGQDSEALNFYRESVLSAPDVSQYHMNLGIAWLRVGETERAYNEFVAAEERDEGDFRATIFKYTVPPKVPPPVKPPADLKKMLEEYEEELRKLEEEGISDDDKPEEWENLPPCDQSYVIEDILEKRYDQLHIRMMQPVADELVRKANEGYRSIFPQFKDAEADWKRYIEGAPKLIAEMYAAQLSAKITSGKVWANLCRSRGYELLGYSDFFLKNAQREVENTFNRRFSEYKQLPHYVQMDLSQIKLQLYQGVLEEEMRYCYEERIRRAFNLINTEETPGELPRANETSIDISSIAAIPGLIITGCFNIEGYCHDGSSYNESIFGGFGGGYDISIGVDLWLIEFEWNLESGEWELNIGQGFIVGATWSPEAGFGVQVGVGLDVDFGPIEVNATTYLKVSQKMSARIEGELTAGVEAGAFYGLSVNAFQIVGTE
jgi:tetratricopeptide (TPR) repeat protein